MSCSSETKTLALRTKRFWVRNWASWLESRRVARYAHFPFLSANFSRWRESSFISMLWVTVREALLWMRTGNSMTRSLSFLPRCVSNLLNSPFEKRGSIFTYCIAATKEIISEQILRSQEPCECWLACWVWSSSDPNYFEATADKFLMKYHFRTYSIGLCDSQNYSDTWGCRRWYTVGFWVRSLRSLVAHLATICRVFDRYSLPSKSSLKEKDQWVSNFNEWL